MSGGGPPSKRPSLSDTRAEDFKATFVTDDPSPASKRRQGIFLVTAGSDVGRVIPVTSGTVVSFGRSEECSARFDDESLSRVHSRCIRFGDTYVLDDAKSTNGTYVNGQRVTSTVQLKDGDAIALGHSTRMRFAMVDDAEQQALVSMYEARKRSGSGRASYHADLEEDLQQARDFQQRLLAEPPRIPGVAIDVLYRPLEQVGGDIYQLHLLADGTLRVLVADAVGHGVQASLTTMLIVSEYETVKNRPTAGAVLAGLNQAISTKYAHARVQFTATCLDFRFDRAELRHASAAHPSPCVLRDGVLTELPGGGPIMGLVPAIDYPEFVTEIAPGDHVLAFSDGCTEVFDDRGQVFGDAGLEKAVLAAAARDAKLGHALSNALDVFASGKPLSDDVTFVSVTWAGA